jgi:hypothetical protein
MTMRLDIVSNDAGELVRLEHARDMGSANVQAVYRLLKLVQIHDLGNQAFLRQLEQTHQAIVDYGLRSGAHFNVLFASKAVFVGGQLLKGSRATYEAATELGDILEWCGGSDLTIQKDVAQKELQLFAEAVGAALRGAKGGSSYKAPSPKIRLRPVTDAARFRGLEVEDLTFEQKVVRTYASAVVIMRRFFADLQASRYVLPRRIKRVAQSLVDLSEGSTPAFLGVTDVRNQNFDDAGRAVNTAILAVSMARELTGDRVLLAQIAMAAMMHDVGRPRAAALGEGGPRMPGVVRLSEDAEDKLAAGTAAVLTALGRVNEPTITRTVVAFEALWLRRERFLGPLYAGGRLPTVHAKIVQISRRYNDLVTPEPGLPEPQPDFAIATISEEMPNEDDRTILRLLVATLNLLPVGTIVQLTTHEVGEIIPSRTVDSTEAGAWVRIVQDARGGDLPRPLEIDLTAPRRAQDPERRIARVLSIEAWGKGLELIAEEEPIESQQPAPEAELELEPYVPEGRVTLDLVPPEDLQLETVEIEPLEDDLGTDQELDTGPSSASVPSIASILSLPGPARDFGPSNISEAPSSVVSAGDGSYPSSGTSPSMVAEAMGKAMVEGAQRAERRPRSVALFEDPMIDVVAQLEELDPTARGTLTSTPIVHVLVYMLDHRQTGTVVLREVDGRHHVIYFDDGRACVVRNGRPLALLGDGLVAAGILSPDALVKALDVARRGGSLLGQYLVGSGLLGAEALRITLSAQVPRKLERLVNLAPDTDYAFYGGVNLIPDWANGELFPCHPLSAILAAVRSWHDRARVRATLSRIAKQPLTFHPEVDLSNLVLTGEEHAVVDAIHTHGATLSSLYDLRIAGEDIVSSLVYMFAVTRSFAFTAAKGPPMVALAVLEEMAEDIEVNANTDPPPPLNQTVATFAPPAVVAPPTQAPPRIAPRPPVAPQAPRALMPQANAPADPSTAVWRPNKVPASQVADPVAPVRVPRPVDAPPIMGAPPSIAYRENNVRKAAPRVQQVDDDDSERLVQAMADFRMAESALLRNDTTLAEDLARKALVAEPTNAEYGALVAWIGALSGSKEAIPLAIAKLNVILKEEALCERALLYRGRLYKRAKRPNEALRDFSSVLDINPKHAEAATEARLLRMKKK